MDTSLELMEHSGNFETPYLFLQTLTRSNLAQILCWSPMLKSHEKENIKSELSEHPKICDPPLFRQLLK